MSKNMEERFWDVVILFTVLGVLGWVVLVTAVIVWIVKQLS